MKKVLWSGLAAGAVIALLAGCAPASESSGATRQTAIDVKSISIDEEAVALLPSEVVHAGTLVIGVDPTYAPNEFKDAEGNPIGWEIDLMDAAAAKLGLSTDYRVAKFDNIVPSILGGKYDAGLGGYYDTLERQKTMNFVDFSIAGNQFASLAESPVVEETDVCGKKVAAQNGGSAPLDYLPRVDEMCVAQGLDKIEVLGYDTQDEATAAVTLGRAYAMVADSPVISYAASLSDGKLVTSPIFESTLSGTPVSRDRGTLDRAIQRALQSLLDDGTYAKIFEFWGVQDAMIDKITINGATE